MRHFELHLSDGSVIDMQDLHSMDNDHGLLTFKYTNTKMLLHGDPYVMHVEFVVVNEDVEYIKDMGFVEEDDHE